MAGYLKKLKVRHFFHIFVVLLLVSFCAVIVLQSHDFTPRVADYSNGSIRLEKNIEFFSGFDTSYLIPDFQAVREVLVSESAYLTLMNYLGLFFLLFLVLVFYTAFVFRPLKDADRVWVTVLFYYLIAAFSVNIVNSFPNNQLMAVAFGAVFMLRKKYSEAH